MKHVILVVGMLAALTATASLNLTITLPHADTIDMVLPDGAQVAVHSSTNISHPPPLPLPDWTIKARESATVVSALVTNLAAQSPDNLRKMGSAAYLCWLAHASETKQFTDAMQAHLGYISAQFLIVFDQAAKADRQDVLLGFWLGIHEALKAKGLNGVVP